METKFDQIVNSELPSEEVTEDSTELKTAEACEHSGVPLSINCGEDLIDIKHAAYGVYSNDNTCGRSYDGFCISESSLQVKLLTDSLPFTSY